MIASPNRPCKPKTITCYIKLILDPLIYSQKGGQKSLTWRVHQSLGGLFERPSFILFQAFLVTINQGWSPSSTYQQQITLRWVPGPLTVLDCWFGGTL